MRANGEPTRGKWKSVPLLEVAEINPGLSRTVRGDETVAFVPMAAVSAETAAISNEQSRTYASVAKGFTPFLRGDVLVAKITPCFENGKIAQANISRRLGFGSTEFHVVRPRRGKLNGRYILHFLRQGHVRKTGEGRMTGSAGQRRVPEHFLSSLKIPLPHLGEQRRIAEVLDRTEALRAKRRAALVQLDKLTSAVFLDVFGDPFTNPRRWDVLPIGECVAAVTNGLTRRRKGSDVGSDIVLRLRDIRAGWVDFSDVNRITLTADESHRYQVEKGDLLFIRVNGNPDYVGRCAAFEGFTEPVYFNDHVMRIKLNRSLMSEVFLAFILNSAYGKRQIAQHRKTSAGQHTISQGGLSRINIPLPPVSLQRGFARKLVNIEKLRKSYRYSLAELDSLFATLQPRAFRGEL